MNHDLIALFAGSRYQPEDTIHSNGPVLVVKARDRFTGELVAIRCFPRPLSVYHSKVLFRTCCLHNKLKHQCIVDFVEVFSAPTCICMAMSYVSGRTLREHVQSHFAAYGHGMEPQAAHIVLYQVVRVLAYMKNQNATYRHLQPNHVLLCGDDSLAVKLIDFLHSRFGVNYCTSKVGDLLHIAPEIFIREQNERWYPDMDLDAVVLGDQYSGEKLDVWGLGVLLYNMLYASFPFNAPDRGQPVVDRMRTVVDRICEKDVQFPEDGRVPARYTELMRRMLTKDPVERISLEDIRGIDWFNGAQYLPQIQDLSMLGPTQPMNLIKRVFNDEAAEGIDHQ